MAGSGCYSKGKTNYQSNSSRGVSYSDGKKSSHADGISTGKAGSSKIKVGYSAGQESDKNRTPDPKSIAPMKNGGRA